MAHVGQKWVGFGLDSNYPGPSAALESEKSSLKISLKSSLSAQAQLLYRNAWLIHKGSQSSLCCYCEYLGRCFTDLSLCPLAPSRLFF